VSGRAAQPGMIEREHHAWGALLQYVEATAIAYRYGRYRKSSKTGKKIDRLITATRELREQLSHEYGWVATEHLIPGDDRDYEGREDWREARIEALRSDVYNGPEIRNLRDFVCFELEGGPPNAALRALGIPGEEYRDQERASFQRVTEKAVRSTLAQAQSLPIPWESTTAALLPPMPVAKTDRRASLQAALLDNPDQPQAAFVRSCHVHPYTVRRCRHELEQAGAIPYLEHRHAT
jgi:hypothetical protein